jgi:hypothetical protein
VHSIPARIPQTPYNLFPFLVPTWILPIKWSSTKAKILERRVPPQKKNDPQKIKEGKGTKGKEVKPHLPIQGREKLHEREREREDENFKSSGRDLPKRK